MKNIIVTGGGTGGHTAAAIAIIERLKESFEDIDVLYIGSHSGLEKDICEKIDWIDFVSVSTGKFRRSLDKRNIADFFRFFKGIFQAWKIIGRRKNRFVLSTGGFVSLPVVIAAFFRKIPVIVHEQTTIPGLANRIAFRFAAKILLSYSYRIDIKKGSRVFLFGNPVRKLVETSFDNNLQDHKEGKPVLFITGGGNGSLLFNRFVYDNIDWLKKNFYVILQYGTHKDNKDFISDKMKQKNEMPDEMYEFVDPQKLGSIYSRRPVLLSRAGAGTITDIINFRLASILVPLRFSAGNEQLVNAGMLFDAGACLLIEESEFKQDKVKQALLNAAINTRKFSSSLEKFERFSEENIINVFSEFLDKE